jgi:hypothetical protein
MKVVKWVWNGLKRVLRFLKCVLTAFCVNEEQPDEDEMERPGGDSTATSGPASGSGGVHPLRELWFKGCHSGMYFIRAMSSGPVWDLELYLWSHADYSQLTLRYNRCRWREHGHNGRFE